jgi:ribosomal protein S18 acetylase RimI-like enzyme
LEELSEIVYALHTMPQQTPHPQIEATSQACRQEVLGLLHLGAARTRRLLEAAASGTIDMSGLFHARRRVTIVGAAWGQITPGRLAFCWPPAITPGEPESTAELLQARVDQFLDEAGILLIQAVLPLHDLVSPMRLTTSGYTHLADLIYMTTGAEHLCCDEPPTALTFIPYALDDPERLKSLIQRTYERTLDCQNLEGVRSLEDVLIGYRHTGIYRPQWWIIAQDGQADVGCLLLADYPAHDQCELMYVGVVPEARGRRWGFQLVQYAQWLAGSAGRRRMVLAVDDVNLPAKAMYEQAGFEPWDRRSVYVRTARSSGRSSPH